MEALFKGKEIYFIIGLLVLYVLAVTINLGYQQLGAEEPRRAIISIEMQESGNYIKATQMGEEYINKPVLFNWILCGMMWITGSSSEWVLRLPSLIFFFSAGIFTLPLQQTLFSSTLRPPFFILRPDESRDFLLRFNERR